MYLTLEAIITVFKEEGYIGIRFTWVFFLMYIMKAQCASLKVSFLTCRHTKPELFCTSYEERFAFSLHFVLCGFKIKFLSNLLLVLHWDYVLSLCMYRSCWLQWESHCRGRHSFARGLLTINARDWNMWRVNSFFFKRYKHTWTLGAWPWAHCSQWKGFHLFQRALDQTGISYLCWDM